jgi:Rieske Fe-S protein
MDPNMTSRRDFLCMTATAAAAVCTGCALFGSRKADVEVEATNGEIRLSSTQSSELLNGEGSLLVGIKGTDRKILVVSAKDGRTHAVSAICTHMGCVVAYQKKVGRIVCPCHGSEFALDGGNLKGPAKRPLDRYGLRYKDSTIVITGV